MSPPFSHVLIANRAEIAVRIIKTCRRLGIHSVAVYSDADAGAMHVREADSAEYIGASPAAESYLNIEAILGAARRSGAEAIHPGYGFLSENADFAEACANAGLVFVGPSPEAIRAMGDKVNARRLMAQAGVPVIPGYDGADGRPEAIATAVQEIGYPLMVKAAAGGGGRGMRVVRRADELNDALESASREAEAAFGDGRIFIEKLIEGGRHIEAQVFGDHTGRIVFLGERECTIQRRHQKVIEECPSSAVDDALRARVADAAVKAGEAVSYTNAGTVEFLLAPDRSFYFLEMNTRLQVEHPVTEEVLGIDLVEWQLKVAAGECVPPVPKSTGHAIEFRLYAEDPARNFSPAPGLVERLELPPTARWDGGYEVGDDIPLDYDSLLGKLIVNGQDRGAALSNSRRALGGAVIQGPATNLPLLRWVVADPDFAEGAFDVAWLERRLTESSAAVFEPPTGAFLSAAAWDITAPQKGFSAWRPAGTRGLLAYSIQGHVCDVWYESARFGQWKLTAHESSWSLSDVELFAGEVSFRLDGNRVTAAVAEDQEVLTVDWNGNRYAVEHCRLRRGGVHSSASGEGLVVRAPMPGVIARILVVRGASVLSGQTVAILEAMKMEHQLNSPADGVVGEILVSEGERVEEGAVILSLAAQGPESESESAPPG